MIDRIPYEIGVPVAVLLWALLIILTIRDRRRRVEASPQLEAHIGHVSPATGDRSTATAAVHRVRSTSREGAAVARRTPDASVAGRTHHAAEHGSSARAVQPASRREARREGHEHEATQRESGTRRHPSVVICATCGRSGNEPCVSSLTGQPFGDSHLNRQLAIGREDAR